MDAWLTVGKGLLIGIANIIPGVSGGTLALMLGIYKRTIDALGQINMRLVSLTLSALLFRQGAWRRWWRRLQDADLFFLGWLGAGAAAAILLSSRLMEWLLERHHAAAYAFFLGLVLCSIRFPWRYLTRRSWREMLSMLLAAVLTVGLSLSETGERKIEKAERRMAMVHAAEITAAAEGIPSSEAGTHTPGRRHLVLVFVAAVLAISAMVLPGISGSFVLLLMGVYFDILRAVNNRDLLVLAVFAAGLLVGLLAFSRLMGFFLNRAFNLTMAFMTGLMAGSLYALWPFRRTVTVGAETLYLGPVLPDMANMGTWTALAVFAAGCALIIGFDRASGGHRERNAGWPSILDR